MLFATLKDVKIRKTNCGGKHNDCQTRNIFYSILNGNFIYYCLTCQKWIIKEHISI